ncbi:MAG: hypothetical protein R3A48_28680 [Polyangiales bacterium]
MTDLDIYRPCYVVDDNTVARHDALGTRPVMGIVEGVDDFGVLVSVGLLGPTRRWLHRRSASRGPTRRGFTRR